MFGSLINARNHDHPSSGAAHALTTAGAGHLIRLSMARRHAIFDEIFRKHDTWFLGRDRVSLDMMSEREHIRGRCDWAAKVLRDYAANAGGQHER
jgi:hypothetical protein